MLSVESKVLLLVSPASSHSASGECGQGRLLLLLLKNSFINLAFGQWNAVSVRTHTHTHKDARLHILTCYKPTHSTRHTEVGGGMSRQT